MLALALALVLALALATATATARVLASTARRLKDRGMKRASGLARWIATVTLSVVMALAFASGGTGGIAP